MVIAAILKARRRRILPFVAGLAGVIALSDWAVGNRMSLGILYVLPMMLGALVLSPLQILFLATFCSALRSCFDLPSPYIEMLLRFIFALIAYSACGLFVAALIRNRQDSLEHMERIHEEKELRRDAEEQLRTLVESSPAAILTVGGDGVVLAANNAANQMFALSGSLSLKGKVIDSYLPVLRDALQVGAGVDGLSTAAQSPGRRENGEIFLANTWFSSYSVEQGQRVAAIVVDSSEEMREHEEENLRQVMRGNRIAASAVSHEVRNLCSAISVVALNLRERHGLAQDEEFKAFETLVQGLEKVSSLDLHSRDLTHRNTGQEAEDLQTIPLRAVLDDLRIVIESTWREIDGAIRWTFPHVSPNILADRHGLLQIFLNLAQNSHRAVQEMDIRELQISVESDERRAIVRFVDTGPGISSPLNLFQPFQPGADGTGLGLYVSRAVARSYGGDLRYESRQSGSCFAIELQVIPPDDVQQ
jgi:signal transduction histidine kinase